MNEGVSFWKFVFKDKIARRYFWIAVVGVVVQFIFFKYLYPYADLGPDAYAYILWASTRVNFAFSPIGYSKFLYVFHLLTHSDTALVACQYLLMVAALLLFFFTLLYWYNPDVIVRNVLFVFFFFNPLFFYVSNNVMSDALFFSLSLSWFTMLLWIIHRPAFWQVWAQGGLLLLLFSIRYYALFYPFIGMVAILFSRHRWPAKVWGILFPLVLIGLFILYTREEAYKATGLRMFSAFSGWQVCNNALYMYPGIQIDSTQLSPESQKLHYVVRDYFNTRSAELEEVSPRFEIASFYMWAYVSPLRKYYRDHMERTGHVQYQSEVELSPLYKAYGMSLIKDHPVEYAHSFLWPNTLNYFYPSLEKLGSYNQGKNDVYDVIMKSWFDYDSMKVFTRAPALQRVLMVFFPFIFLLANLLLMLCYGQCVVQKQYRHMTREFVYVLLLVAILFVVNMVFSITAAVVVFRYQIFVMIVYVSFSLLLVEPYLKRVWDDAE